MSIAGIIKRAARRSGKRVTLTRYKIGTNRDGVFHAEILEKRPIDASVQPLDEDAMQQTPDNLERLSSMVQIFSVERLLPADKTAGQKADELDIDGETFVVIKVANWQHRRLKHFESIAELKRSSQ